MEGGDSLKFSSILQVGYLLVGIYGIKAIVFHPLGKSFADEGGREKKAEGPIRNKRKRRPGNAGGSKNDLPLFCGGFDLNRKISEWFLNL